MYRQNSAIVAQILLNSKMAAFQGEMEHVIGIDLGTTFSCVAVWDEATGRVEVLPNSQVFHF